MDIYTEITNRMIAEMEAGEIPWRKPWMAAGAAISHTTGKPYSLLNQMLLGRAGEYVTYKQAQQEGGWIRKGEKASMVVFWKWMTVKDEAVGALSMLGFSPAPSAKVVTEILKQHPGIPVEQVVKMALKQIK